MENKVKKLPLRSFYPPAISTINGKSYLLINNGNQVEWIDVPYGYELEDIYKEFEYVPIVPSVPKVIEKSKIVKSKSGNGEYKVTYKKFENGKVQFDCSCPGATYRGKCKHIEEYKKQLKIK